MKQVARAIPAVLASMVLAAHFLRAGFVVVAAAIALAPLLLLWRSRRSVRFVQGLLATGVIVWIHTLVVLAAERNAAGAPFVRMCVILLVVALITALGAYLLEPLASRDRPLPEDAKQG